MSWDEHVRRGVEYAHFCCILLHHHDTDWLLQMRSAWVATNSSNPDGGRNSVFGGRSGTRVNNGRPQVRWADGVAVAKQVSQGRSLTLRGNNAVTIGTLIREAVVNTRALFDQQPPRVGSSIPAMVD